MATVILNVAAELSSEYEIRNIEVSLINTIQTKSDLAMKYSTSVNSNGSGFIDTVWCPDSVDMIGTTQSTLGISTVLKNNLWVIFCQWVHAWENFEIYFNSGSTDLSYAQYKWVEVNINSSLTNNTFSDSDTTQIDVSSSFPLVADNIDDSFDSDNYKIFSTGSILYPDIFSDDDVEARLKTYWYVIENSEPYNVFWSNDEMQRYIDENTNNLDNYYNALGSTWSGYLYLDIAASHRIILFEISKSDYIEAKELRVTSQIQWPDASAGLWYLQQDMSLASGTGSAYIFDFTTHDYALFIDNTSSDALLYQITWEDALTGSWLYITPLKDDDTALYSFLGSHMLIGQDGNLIGTQLELFGLK